MRRGGVVHRVHDHQVDVPRAIEIGRDDLTRAGTVSRIRFAVRCP